MIRRQNTARKTPKFLTVGVCGSVPEVLYAPSPLGWCWGQTFGLTCYDNSFVFMPSKIYFFNHRCCEQLHKVNLLIVTRKCRICLRNEFGVEKVHSEMLKVYGDNKHKHKGDRIIFCCGS